MPWPGVSSDAGKLAFWVHQSVEYVIASLLVLTVAHVPPALALPVLASAVVIAVLAALTDGPLGVNKPLSRRTHVWLDRVVMLALVAGPLAWHGRDLTAAALSECLGIVLGLLARRTAHLGPPRLARHGPATTGAGPLPSTAELLRMTGFALGRATDAPSGSGPRLAYRLGRRLRRHRR